MKKLLVTSYHRISIFVLVGMWVVFYVVSIKFLTPYVPLEVIRTFEKILLVFLMATMMLNLGLLYWVRNQLILFTQRLVEVTDSMMNQEKPFDFRPNEETLLSKAESQLHRLMELMQKRTLESQQEKEEMHRLISDLSHQIKTPLANVMMYNDTLFMRELDPTQQKFCMSQMKDQLNKLEFLIQSLLKMSRFENGIIQLYPTQNVIHETLSNVLSTIRLKAQAKQVKLNIYCEESLKAYFDPKWTGEALFNVIENAVKYTPEQGEVTIRVIPWELFTKIDVIDSGIGIQDDEYPYIFQRFYRSLNVSHIEGVGIGLYLTREILIKQGGYIKVQSKPGIGSTFSIFLRNTI